VTSVVSGGALNSTQTKCHMLVLCHGGCSNRQIQICGSSEATFFILHAKFLVVIRFYSVRNMYTGLS